MAVVVETTIGDFTVDLFVDSRPHACKNFLKLCKMKYYNFCLFHSVQSNFLAQTGDPTGTGSGGESIYGLLYGENARYFEAEKIPKLKHNKPGLLSMVNCGNNMLGSQFFITLGEELVSLDGEHCVFGEISEGVEIVLKLNEAICDAQHRPYKDIRITHTIILEDPFDDPSGLIAPDMSPEATQERLANGRIGADEEVDETQGLTAEEVEEMRQEREAKARATILEIVGDLPDADMAPPENVLFVCKLNPVTTDDDLEIIFSRFGKVKSCEVIRDKNTGDSLQYAFVEFEDQKACEDAYFKMDNVLIDDRRIHVDFSQSVAKMRWKGKGRGVEYFDNKDQSKESKSSGNREREGSRPRGERSNRREREREFEERDRRKDRGRDREEDRGRDRERERGRDSDDRHRRRDERDRSRSDWRKRDKRDYREDDKRYDKRREVESTRKREDDTKRVSSSSSSRKVDDKKPEVKRIEEKRIDIKEKERSVNGKSGSRQRDFINSESIEKSAIKIEKQEILDKEKGRGSKYNSPLHVASKDEMLSDSFNDSQEIPTAGEDSEKSLSLTVNKDVPEVSSKTSSGSRRSSKDDKKMSEMIKQEDFETDRVSEGRSSQRSDTKVVEPKGSQEKEKKKSMKRKRKESESRKRKKRRHSSSSESSSDSSDSSDSSSSSDSSDCKRSKKKKLIVAKKYYRGGKLVKEVKKKKRTKDTSDSESGSEESSDSDSKRKHKSKKHKKVVSVYKQGKKKSVQSSEDSQSESSSSDDSDDRSRKKKKKANEKHAKKKSKHSSRKKKRRKNHSSSSSDSDDSVESKLSGKKHKKIKNSKHSTNLVTTTSE